MKRKLPEEAGRLLRTNDASSPASICKRLKGALATSRAPFPFFPPTRLRPGDYEDARERQEATHHADLQVPRAGILDTLRRSDPPMA